MPTSFSLLQPLRAAPRLHQALRLPIGALCLGLLGACGGGGGSSADSGAPIVPAPVNGLGINAGNYQQVAQAAVSSSAYLLSTGDLALSDTPGAGLGRLAESPLAKAQLARPAAVNNRTLPCTLGGSLLLSADDKNNNGKFDTGDSVSTEARGCREDDMTIQGKLAFSAKSLSGDFGSNNYSATLQLSLGDFAVTEAGDTVTGNGSLEMQVAVASGAVELTLAVDSFTVSGSDGGLSFSHTVRDARLTLRIPSSGSQTSSMSATLSGNRLENKSVRVDTQEAFVTAANADFPSSGRMLVSGANGSKVRISAQNTNQALVELDADGDGTFETRSTKAWAELR
ncbi:hypothetical protein G8A07_16325 [Roseateles sp. DAIF2]|uniref:hypothetical protein n=1 Tax=Roseateles sp. DAIF2 TaxID=2714952 RepID=UPI0018A2C740|nr:hypothetical protein [Roseateles sp. DAIF2]QPF74335.1 hypothetical protein G8A07_16325 [Roseateles sp. DAIF2]